MADIEKLLKQAAMQIGAGGSAGFVEVCIMHPLDLVKTRLQLQATAKSSLKGVDPQHYNGISDCMKKMYKHEGLASFWKGILPPILAETPKRAVKFATFEQYKKIFLFGSNSPTPLTFALAGLGSGITEAIFVNPFEVVKVTLQSNRALAAQVPSTWTVTRQIVRENGLGFRGLNKGLTATIARNGIFTMVYFGFYHSVKGYLPECEDPLLEFGRKVAIGFTSGVLGSCVNIPFDVAKSRIQGPQPTPGVIKYSSTTGAIMLVYREEGFRALYKGLLPKVLRLGPGGAIMRTMDQMQAPASLPHVVQVYPSSVTIHPSLQSQGKVSYQQTITSESLHIPVSSRIHDISSQHLISQNQNVCHQIHLQNVQPLQTQMTSQVIQGDMSQLQITSHVILPQVPVFKQHLLSNSIPQSYYGPYETYIKDAQCVIAKVEPNIQMINEKQPICKSEDVTHIDVEKLVTVKKRARSQIPNPNKWACNIRKHKHQRGEAYISRRGKYVPERKVRNTKDCLKSCRYKCNERINDVDRQLIFKAFYSLNANEKKHFLLNTTERYSTYKQNKVLDVDQKRKYAFKYFFLVRGVRYIVCKIFYLGTLAISQKPVYNVHTSKSEMNLPKPDGRGLSETSTHSLPTEIKEKVRSHIMSFSTMDSKPIKQFSRKKQYIECDLSIKQMYNMYATECEMENSIAVKESMYRKIFKQEFNLHFKKDKTNQQLCCRCRGSIKKK